MSNFVLDALGLFRRKRIVKKVENSDFIMLASTNVGNRSRETQGQMRSRLIRATDLGGGTGTCPVVYLPPKIGENKGVLDPAFLVIDGENCNQYYKVTLDGDTIPVYTLTIGTASGKTVIAPPAGTYIIIIEYEGGVSPMLGFAPGIEWPLGITPTLSNTSGKVDIITIVSDGETSRGVATIGYNA